MNTEPKTEPGVILPDGTTIWLTSPELRDHPAFTRIAFPYDQVTRAAFDQHYTALQTALGLRVYMTNHPTFVERTVETVYGEPTEIDPYETWGTPAAEEGHKE